MTEWTHPEMIPDEVIDRSSLDLAEVLHEISASIKWLSHVRDAKKNQPETGFAAIDRQTPLVEQYRLLRHDVDHEKRFRQDEHSMARIQGQLEQMQNEDG